jgi:hypothetical protein
VNDFLEKFRALRTPESRDKFLIEINAHVDAYAKFTDQLKRLHFNWNRETNDLCIIRDLIIQDLKENKLGMKDATSNGNG